MIVEKLWMILDFTKEFMHMIQKSGSTNYKNKHLTEQCVLECVQCVQGGTVYNSPELKMIQIPIASRMEKSIVIYLHNGTQFNKKNK